MQIKEKLPGIFLIDNKLATENSIRGFKPFSGQLIEIKNKEYRFWDPHRSKASAAIIKGIKEFPIKKGDYILYLGAAHGFTISFLRDIIGKQGIIYGVEISERCFNELLPLCEKYKNIVPILADARSPEKYENVILEKVDVIYEDVADPEQVQILIRNSKLFLKQNGYAMLAVKARSIDVTKNPNQIYKEVLQQLKEHFEIIDWKKLEPFEADHCFIVMKKK